MGPALKAQLYFISSPGRHSLGAFTVQGKDCALSPRNRPGPGVLELTCENSTLKQHLPRWETLFLSRECWAVICSCPAPLFNSASKSVLETSPFPCHFPTLALTGSSCTLFWSSLLCALTVPSLFSFGFFLAADMQWGSERRDPVGGEDDLIREVVFQSLPFNSSLPIPLQSCFSFLQFAWFHLLPGKHRLSSFWPGWKITQKQDVRSLWVPN